MDKKGSGVKKMFHIQLVVSENIQKETKFHVCIILVLKKNVQDDKKEGISKPIFMTSCLFKYDGKNNPYPDK